MRPHCKIILFARDTKKGRPVMLRVTLNTRSAYISLKLHCPPELWDADKCRFRKGFPDYRRQNDLLAIFEARAADIIFDWSRANIPFDFDRFEKAMFADTADKARPMLSQVLNAEREQMEQQNRQSYAHLLKSLIDLVAAFQRHKRRKYTLSEITPDWLNSLDNYVAQNTEMGNGWQTLYKILRACLNRAKKAYKMPADWNPCEGFVSGIESRKPAKRAISLTELRAFIETSPESEFEAFTKDLFLLSFYLWGMNLADIAELTRDNIVEGRVVYRRKKTGREYSIAMPPQAGAIFDKYRNRGRYLIPIYQPGANSKQKHLAMFAFRTHINKALRALAGRAGINPKSFTFYVARHTFATALKRAGFSHGLIQDALGHSDAQTTNAYLDSFSADALDMAAGAVIAELG